MAEVVTHLHRATPSFSASSKSPAGSLSPSISSTHCRASFVAAGVYLSRRILRKSLSKDVTDAMADRRVPREQLGVVDLTELNVRVSANGSSGFRL